MLNEDQIKKLFNDPMGEIWGRFNTWLMEDDELSEEALFQVLQKGLSKYLFLSPFGQLSVNFDSLKSYDST